MGQREVKNWLRSTASKNVTMRYPGEWNFPGGSVESGETLEEAARRELQEEFLLDLPSAKLRLVSIKQTRAVRGTTNVMYNFVALAEDAENGWLRDLDVDAKNAELMRRRDEHQRLVASGKFWELPRVEKEALAPETRQLRWLELHDAVSKCFGSMVGPPMVPIDDWQLAEFRRYGVSQRDFMFIVMQTCLDIEAFPSAASLIRHALADDQVDPELRLVQWLFPGMSLEEADRIFWERVQDRHRFSDASGRPSWLALRAQRRAEDLRDGVRTSSL